MTPLIRIRRWLMQPNVWRIVGFVSAVVGLLCYALSSSFNQLFGPWSLLKIFLYSVFSFIISLMILYANIWQHSRWRSLLFKAHSAFLFLTITAVYSFYSDQKMSGKPDAYSLISCAAFAVMSLSLSRQIQCGFEVDLLYFFLVCLILLLMKIKWQLFPVGTGFSYCLIILRWCLDAEPENENPGLQDQNNVVIEMDSRHLASIDISSIMEQLKSCAKALQQKNSNVIDLLLKQVKEYLEDDSEFVGSSSNTLKTDPNFIVDTLPPEMINYLHQTANLMVNTEFEKEYSDVYISCRRACLEECLTNKLLGLQKLSIEDVHKMSWKDLKREIKRWVRASNVALKILFPCERRLCDRVFFGLSSAADFSFAEVCRESAVQMLNFAYAVAVRSPSPEQLFSLVDMFETLRDLIPEFESLFCDQNSVSMRNEATAICKRLGNSIRRIFIKLQNLIPRDQQKKIGGVPGGVLHPITENVMYYLDAACRFQQTMEHLFEASSPSVQMGWIMEQLESNLEARSKLYEDPVLCFVFLMKNGTYMVRRIKDGGLRIVFGNEWIWRLDAEVLQYHVTMDPIIHTPMQNMPSDSVYAITNPQGADMPYLMNGSGSHDADADADADSYADQIWDQLWHMGAANKPYLMNGSGSHGADADAHQIWHMGTLRIGEIGGQDASEILKGVPIITRTTSWNGFSRRFSLEIPWS